MLKYKLLQALQFSLNCNLARLKSLSLLTTAILQHRTVNLVILARGIFTFGEDSAAGGIAEANKIYINWFEGKTGRSYDLPL